MKPAERILTVERPDVKGTIDFLSDGVSVTAEIVDGKIRVVVRASHGEDASTWDLHEVEYVLPILDPVGEPDPCPGCGEDRNHPSQPKAGHRC